MKKNRQVITMFLALAIPAIVININIEEFLGEASTSRAAEPIEPFLGGPQPEPPGMPLSFKLHYDVVANTDLCKYVPTSVMECFGEGMKSGKANVTCTRLCRGL